MRGGSETGRSERVRDHSFRGDGRDAEGETMFRVTTRIWHNKEGSDDGRAVCRRFPKMAPTRRESFVATNDGRDERLNRMVVR